MKKTNTAVLSKHLESKVLSVEEVPHPSVIIINALGFMNKFHGENRSFYLRHGRSQARSEKRGGSSVGPAPPPRKENYATETCTTNENNTSVMEEAGSGLPGRMMCCGESQKEATMPMTLLSTRKTLNIGTCNVRTIYEAGKTAQVTAKMRRFNLAVLGLCETRWTQSGQLQSTTGQFILYSGHEEEAAPHS